MQEIEIRGTELVVSDEIAKELEAYKGFQVFKTEIENKEKLFRLKLKEAMKAAGVNKVTLEGVGTFSYIRPTTRKTFDSKRFKVDHPDLYGDYEKISAVDDSVRATYE